MILKKNYFISSLVLLLIINISTNINYTHAIELDETTRTVKLNDNGENIVLTLEQVKKGKRLFNNTCAQCHAGGITKTNPNIGLEEESLSLATPPRNNIEALISFMKNPRSYDGREDIDQIHPSVKSAEIFPKMRNLTDDDLYTIAGHILLQPKVVSEKWGGGKIYY
uniref:Photosystem II extrinsic protein V n=1 Tax=Compsopogon caeruleus TaxID=31354 RepID=A0A1Z1XAV2_9RHOD|nr:oxygen-evolving complex component [Compsopogon caeruleus]ARX95982.1 oxygen-evolving complex component [Compsopogon caeruleus]